MNPLPTLTFVIRKLTPATNTRPHRRRSLPSWIRIIALCLVPVQFLATIPVTSWAESTSPKTSDAAPAQATSNAPAASPKPPTVTSVSMNSQFSSQPTDEEIYWAHILNERLVPIGGKTSPEENHALAGALMAYYKLGLGEDVSPITEFLDAHPATPWRAALLTNLGTVYRQTGLFTKALAAWEEAWELSKGATDPRAHALADQTVGELAQINAWFGRFDRLESLSDEIEEAAADGIGRVESQTRKRRVVDDAEQTR